MKSSRLAAIAVAAVVVAGTATAQDFSRPASGPHSGPSSGPGAGPATTNGRAFDDHHAAITVRFPTPAGYERVKPTTGFGFWLRRRVILPESTPVRRFDGEKAEAPWAKGIVKLGFLEGKDLQQCADSAIRLYAEYVRSDSYLSTLSMHATSGDPIPYTRYEKGERVVPKGKGLEWTAWPLTSRTSVDEIFDLWLEDVFTYAGSISLEQDTDPVVNALWPGDLLVLPGSPGHVVVVMDVAEDIKGSGRQQLLLGQGFMPAQTFHMLGWFTPADDGSVTVPSWPKPFDRKSRRRFK